MKNFLGNALAAVCCLAALTLLCLAWFSPQSLYADPPAPVLPADERPMTDDVKPELLADPVDKSDVEMKDLGGGVYRVEVKTSADSREDYEAALVKFCKDHADCMVSVSSAPANQKGNTGVTTYYWVACKK
ncbi:MAG: hypothetical protein Q7S83_01190 [bacterium]|nr:hypothetical protein [bacterium]